MEKFSPPSIQNAEPSQDTATKEVSLELPKELLEKVLEKTVDIDAYGTAFSVVGEYNPDRAKDRIKERRETREPYRKTFEDFKKQISESGYLQTGGGHYTIPLIKSYGYGSRESMYQRYRNLNKVPDGKYYIDERLLGLVGTDSNEPVSEKNFNDRYDELLEKDISEVYQMYSQTFEEKISGKSFEKYRAELRENYGVGKSWIFPLGKLNHVTENFIDMVFEDYKKAVEETREKKDKFGNSPEYSGYYAKLFKRLGFDNKTLQDVTLEEFTERCKKEAVLQEKEFEEEAQKSYEEYFASYNEDVSKKMALRPFVSIFRNGIFGGRRWRTPSNNFEAELQQPEALTQTPEAWAKDVRTKDPEEKIKKERHVFFNIVGKFHNDDLSYTWDEAWGGTNHNDKMKDSQWFFKGDVTGVPKNVVAVIFDKEGMPFFSDDPNGGTPHSEHGYAGPVRVAPRKFLGLVVQCTEQGERVYEDGSKMSTTVLSTDSEKWQRSANGLAETLLQVDETHPDRLIPIYDVYGNMLWPTKMTHEEIQNKLKEKTAPSI